MRNRKPTYAERLAAAPTDRLKESLKFALERNRTFGVVGSMEKSIAAIRNELARREAR